MPILSLGLIISKRFSLNLPRILNWASPAAWSMNLSHGKKIRIGGLPEITAGAIKGWRRECFEEMGGLVRGLGWDGLDCLQGHDVGLANAKLMQMKNSRCSTCAPKGPPSKISTMDGPGMGGPFIYWSPPAYGSLPARLTIWWTVLSSWQASV